MQRPEMNRNKTVLVISDGHEQFASTASLLRDDGYAVYFEKDVSSCMMLAGDSPPHLIISELAAPNVDGLKLCRRVQNDRKFCTTPVLLVGDLSITSSIVDDGFRCGAVDYIQRPIDSLRLADICRDILQQNIHERAESIEKPADELTSIYSVGDNSSNFDNMVKNDSLRTALFENSRTGLAIFSASGELVETNPALRSMLDYSEDELNGMTVSEFFFPYDIETGKRALEELLTGKRKCFQSTNGYLTPFGECLWGSLTIIAVTDADAGSRLLIGVFDDPTNQNHQLSEPPFRSTSIRVGDPTILDLTQWKLDMGLICKN